MKEAQINLLGQRGWKGKGASGGGVHWKHFWGRGSLKGNLLTKGELPTIRKEKEPFLSTNTRGGNKGSGNTYKRGKREKGNSTSRP